MEIQRSIALFSGLAGIALALVGIAWALIRAAQRKPVSVLAVVGLALLFVASCALTVGSQVTIISKLSASWEDDN